MIWHLKRLVKNRTQELITDVSCTVHSLSFAVYNCCRLYWTYTPNPLPRLSQEEMTSALATMRVDYDQVKIKDLDTSSNPLLNKRRKKAAAGAKSGSTVCQSQWDTEDY